MESDCDESEAADYPTAQQQDGPSPPLLNEQSDQSAQQQSAAAGSEMEERGEAQPSPPHQQALAMPEHMPSPEELVQKGQYLVDSPSWLSFMGEDKRLQYSNHFISRNDKIWELISTEIRYVDLLVVIRDVFLRSFPPRSATSLRLSDNLFPYLDTVLEGHSRLLFFMLEAHGARPDHVTTNLGQCFINTLTENTLNLLIEAYAALMFVQSSLTDSLNKLKCNRNFAERLAACEKEPRTKRRTVTDCYMIIIQRWTKIETLLSGIISDTIVQDDSTELNDLNVSRRGAQTLLLGAQQKMTDLVHADKLRHFAENLREDWTDVDGGSGRRSLLDWMRAPNAHLINCDKLAIQVRREGGKVANIELIGVALRDCFFLLRQDPETGKYYLYRDASMPPILIWTKHFGYFRDQAGSPLTFIILMDSKNSAPTLTKFVCSTHDEVARWQKIFTEGFDNFGKVDESFAENAMPEKMVKEIEAAEERRKRQEEKLELINQLSADIFAQWEVRNTVFRTLFVDEGLGGCGGGGSGGTIASRSNSGRSVTGSTTMTTGSNNSAVGTNSSKRKSLTGQSDSQLGSDDDQARVRVLHERFMKNVMRLASLIGEGDPGCLSRSASDAADRRPSSSSIVVTSSDVGATNGDAFRKRSDKDGVTYRMKTKGHHIKGHRLSIESQSRLSSLLRSGNRQKGDGASLQDYSRDEYNEVDRSEGTSDSSLPSLTNPSLLVAEIQELGRSLLEIYNTQYRQCLNLEKDNIRLRTEVELAKGQTSINTKRELESLRSLQKKTEDEQNAWNSYKQKEEARLEREDQKLKSLAKDLAEKQQQYEENRRTLQNLIDIHASRGIDVSVLRGSNSSLNTVGQNEIERNVVSPLSHHSSARYDSASDLSDRRPGHPPTVMPRYSQPPSSVSSPQSERVQYVGTHPPRPPIVPHPVPSMEPPPQSVKHQTRLASLTSSTLGSLPAKLASKTRNSKSFHRH